MMHVVNSSGGEPQTEPLKDTGDPFEHDIEHGEEIGLSGANQEEAPPRQGGEAGAEGSES